MSLSKRITLGFGVFCIVMILFVSTPNVFAQTGAWVSHPYDLEGTDSTVYGCGGTTAYISKKISSSMLFFDTNSGAWSDATVPTTQTWDYFSAEGDLAMAASDSFVVVYNGQTSTAHPLRFSGERLDTRGSYWSYRCGAALAYMVTDEAFYVFDVELDAWQQIPVTPPADLTRCNSNVGADWVGASFQGTANTVSQCFAYSLTHHAFAQTDDGPLVGPTTGTLDHGFAGTNFLYPELTLVGYSAVTNTFTRESIPNNYSSLQYGNTDQHGKVLRTVFAAVCGVSGSDPRESHFYGYDTRRGTWTYELITFDGADYSHWYNIDVGGQYAVTTFDVVDTDQLAFRVYSGIDGSITTHYTNLYESSTLRVTGGTVYVASQKDGLAWGLDVESGNSNHYTLPTDQYYGLRTSGENFIVLGMYDYVRDVMDIMAYHGPSNTWQTTTTWRTTQLSYTSGAYSYMFPGRGDNLDVLFFSGLQGTFNRQVFADTPNPILAHSPYLSYLLSDGGDGCLYDAHRDIVYRKDLQYDYAGLGEAVFVGVDMDTESAWGYSAVSGLWTEAPVGEAPRVGQAGRYIGWAADAWPSHKYLAYNGFHDCWTELDMIGNSVGVALGDETMLVYHYSTIWAYDPDAPPLHTEDPDDPGEDIILPKVLAMQPAFPNPFNAATKISFDLPRSEHVRLNAFDLRGRKVSTLTNEIWPAGSHHLIWDGTTDDGGALPSGVYFFQLETDGKIITERATLVK